MPTPNFPRYVSPKERAQNRARYRAWLYWTAVALPLLVALMMFGYSDGAPLWLSRITIGLDAACGYPVLWLIKLVAA